MITDYKSIERLCANKDVYIFKIAFTYINIIVKADLLFMEWTTSSWALIC